MLVPEASDWIVPMVWFTLFFAFLCLAIILTKQAGLLALFFVLALSSSFFFASSPGHLMGFIFGFLFLFAGMERIKRDIKNGIRINLWRSIRMGRMLLVLGLSVVITSQYYFEAVKIGADKIIPKFEMNSQTSELTTKILARINPDFAVLENDELTIDELLFNKIKEQSFDETDPRMASQIDQLIEAQMESVVGETTKKEIKKEAITKMNKESSELMLEEGRKQFSKITGYNLTGQEKVSEVIASIVNNKINEFFQPGIGGPASSSAIPFIFAIILFLTLISIGPFLAALGSLFSILIFKILVKAGIVAINKVPTEAEVIE